MTLLREYPNIDGYGFGLGVARASAGVSSVMSSRGVSLHGLNGNILRVDPAESLAVVFMAQAPGVIRYYHRQVLHALVMQSLD